MGRTLCGSVGVRGKLTLAYAYFTLRRASGRAPAVGASHRVHSRAIVPSTRQPSRNVCKFEAPEIRSSSMLGTSAIRSPARAALTISSVSISNPSDSSSRTSRHWAAESHIAVAKVRVVAVKNGVGETCQCAVAGSPQPGQVLGPPSGHVSGTFDEVIVMLEGRNEPADLLRIHASVRIQHDDDVA